jgi:hypothetical protein
MIKKSGFVTDLRSADFPPFFSGIGGARHA